MGKILNEKYRDYLKKVQDLVSDYMNKTYKHTEENLTKLFYSFQQRVKEEEDILNKFSQLSAQSEDLLKQVVDSIIAENKKRLDLLVQDLNKALDKQQKLLDQYAKKSADSLEKIGKQYKDNLETEQQILASYLELAEKTANLTKIIDSIDFPKRLDTLDTKLDSLNKKQDSYYDSIRKAQQDNTQALLDKLETVLSNQEELYALIEKNHKRIVGNKVLIWFIFVLSLLFYAAATTGFLRLFTDFFDSFCK
jgi:tetrahydromethanopterin S-methyltransferase subunit B